MLAETTTPRQLGGYYIFTQTDHLSSFVDSRWFGDYTNADPFERPHAPHRLRLRGYQRLARTACDISGEAAHSIHQLRRGYDLRDQADAQCLGGIDASARQGEIAGGRTADQLDPYLGLESGVVPQGDPAAATLNYSGKPMSDSTASRSVYMRQ